MKTVETYTLSVMRALEKILSTPLYIGVFVGLPLIYPWLKYLDWCEKNGYKLQGTRLERVGTG